MKKIAAIFGFPNEVPVRVKLLQSAHDDIGTATCDGQAGAKTNWRVLCKTPNGHKVLLVRADTKAIACALAYDSLTRVGIAVDTERNYTHSGLFKRGVEDNGPLSWAEIEEVFSYGVPAGAKGETSLVGIDAYDIKVPRGTVDDSDICKVQTPIGQLSCDGSFSDGKSGLMIHWNQRLIAVVGHSPEHAGMRIISWPKEDSEGVTSVIYPGFGE